MKTIIELMTEQFQKAFEECGYSKDYARITVSNRPDLCEYQCNGAMAAAKAYKKAPFMIADEVVSKLADNRLFSSVESVKPGFINIKISPEYLAGYMNDMAASDKYGYQNNEQVKTVIVDFGGANAAKPLHVGHLRSAVIGESVKRINRFVGNRTIGDVHLGDGSLVKFSVYGNKYEQNQTDMLGTICSSVIAKHPDKLEEAADALLCIDVKDYTDVAKEDRPVYFSSMNRYEVNGTAYSVGGSFGMKEKLKMIARLLIMCDESKDIIDIEDYEIPDVKVKAAAGTKKKINYFD